MSGVLQFVSFVVLYFALSFTVVPVIAKFFDREPLPTDPFTAVQPTTKLTWILNRHYVKPVMREAVLSVATKITDEFPGSTLNYLDANFPFFDGFPLVPHLSHNDGKKLDLAFYYDLKNGEYTNTSPSIIGYGVYEEPMKNEENTPHKCIRKGFWQYSLLGVFVPQGRKVDYKFNPERTAGLVKLFAAEPAIGKIFIEPHLKERLKLTSYKIRFHGCGAVRHDDHLHVQLK